MHIRGKAIDLYFPDVPVAKLRGSAIVRQIGGVGYYPRSGTSGFVHIDSGKVRYWPRPSDTQLAQIMKDYRKTLGARLTNGYMTAQAETGTMPPFSGPPAMPRWLLRRRQLTRRRSKIQPPPRSWPRRRLSLSYLPRTIPYPSRARSPSRC